METHTILLKLSKFGLCQNNINSQQIIDIVNYVLRPFKQLKVFAYNDYVNVPATIYGNRTPELLIQEVEMRETPIFKNSLESDSINKHIISRYPSEKRLKDFLLSTGVYAYESQFLNTSNNTSIITEETLKDITENPSDYVLVFTNLYK